MGGDFDDIVGGVGVGLLEPGDDDFVDFFAGSVMGPAGGSRSHTTCRFHKTCRSHIRWLNKFAEKGVVGLERVLELQQRFGDGARVGAGETDDADPAASGRGGDGDDGVVEVHESSLIDVDRRS